MFEGVDGHGNSRTASTILTQKNAVMSPVEPGIKNDSAGESQEQFTITEG
jgi:hypothetical protein